MLSLPGHPILAKEVLIGGCLRLPLSFEANALAGQLEALPPAFWSGAGGRVGVHRQAEALFLRGYAPAEGERPVEDRPALASLSEARVLIESIPASPLRCLVAKLPPMGRIAPHVDLPDYFAKTLRLHFPIVSNEQAEMFCGGRVYCMRPGEIWALNNSTVHAVRNGDPRQARTHLICDFLPSPGLLALLDRGQRELGVETADITRFCVESPQPPVAGPSPAA